MPPLFTSWLSSDLVSTPVVADKWTSLFCVCVKYTFSWLHLANSVCCHPLHACWSGRIGLRRLDLREHDWQRPAHRKGAWDLCPVDMGYATVNALMCTGVSRSSGVVHPLTPLTSIFFFFSCCLIECSWAKKHGKCVHVNGYFVSMQPCSEAKSISCGVLWVFFLWLCRYFFKSVIFLHKYKNIYIYSFLLYAMGIFT